MKDPVLVSTPVPLARVASCQLVYPYFVSFHTGEVVSLMSQFEK